MRDQEVDPHLSQASTTRASLRRTRGRGYPREPRTAARTKDIREGERHREGRLASAGHLSPTRGRGNSPHCGGALAHHDPEASEASPRRLPCPSCERLARGARRGLMTRDWAPGPAQPLSADCTHESACAASPPRPPPLSPLAPLAFAFGPLNSRCWPCLPAGSPSASDTCSRTSPNCPARRRRSS